MTCPLPDEGLGILGTAAWKKLIEQLAGKKCVAIGPGLGTAPGTQNLLARLLPQNFGTHGAGRRRAELPVAPDGTA